MAQGGLLRRCKIRGSLRWLSGPPGLGHQDRDRTAVSRSRLRGGCAFVKNGASQVIEYVVRHWRGEQSVLW